MYSAKVLVVDDSPTMRQFIMFALQRLPGLQIHEAGNGVNALKLLSLGENRSADDRYQYADDGWFETGRAGA